MKWEYFQAYCSFEEKCLLCKDERGKPKAHWMLNTYDGKHYWIQDGLDALGARGWELVAVQQTSECYGGTGNWHYLSYLYIFKRLLDSSK